MNRLKTRIRRSIRRTLLKEREALKDMLDHEDAADVIHAVHDTWSGGEALSRWGTDDGLPILMPIDHAAAVGSDPATKEQETIDHSTGKVIKISDKTISLSEDRLRDSIRRILILTSRTQ